MFTLKRICDKAKECKIKNIYLFVHQAPDCDAKGSALSLCEYFKSQQFNSKLILSKPNFTFMEVFGDMDATEESELELPFIAVIVDTSNEENTENDYWRKASYRFRIDHHAYHSNFKSIDEDYLVSDKSSTCEIVAGMLKEEGFELNKKVAEYLYMGIISDTSLFSYYVTSELFDICSYLLRAPVDVAYLMELKNKLSPRMIKCTATIQLNYKNFGKFLRGYIADRSTLESLGVDPVYFSKCVNSLKPVYGTKTYFCAARDIDGSYVVEMRSSQDSLLDVGEIAQKYGGGGHMHASGCRVKNYKELTYLIDLLKSE